MRHTTLGPAVKTSDPGSAPRGAGRAVGGIRAQGKNPGRRASSPSTLLPSRPFVCADPKNSARTRSPAPASADSLQRPSPFATELARRGIIERDPPHEETAPRIGISTHHELPRAIESAGTDDLDSGHHSLNDRDGVASSRSSESRPSVAQTRVSERHQPRRPAQPRLPACPDDAAFGGADLAVALHG